MRVLWLASVGIAVAAISPVYGNKSLPKPTPENLAGVWVASGPWGNQYRLVLKPDGTGSLGEIGPNGEPFLFNVEGLEIDGYKIRVVVTSRTGDSLRHILRGDGTSRSLALKGKAAFAQKTTFYPETQMRDASNRLVTAMDAHTE
jgi:hypothetical protein